MITVISVWNTGEAGDIYKKSMLVQISLLKPSGIKEHLKREDFGLWRSMGKQALQITDYIFIINPDKAFTLELM